jgi:hypothetical protein
LASVPTLAGRRRKSIAYHITKRHFKRTSLKSTTDFNSQILSHENSQDFTNIVCSISHAPQKPLPPSPRHEEAAREDGFLLKIARYPSIKNYDDGKQAERRISRYST